MLSILIPVYNYDAQLLVKTLHRQAEKANTTFEILLADDCSTDQQIKMQNKSCKSLSNCRLFEFSENKGRTFTRNFLAKKATYDWLLFLDADVLPKKDDFIKQFLVHPDLYDLIFGGITYRSETPERNKILRWKYGKERETKSVEERQKTPYLSIISGAFLCRKKLFLTVNQYLKNAYGLDIFFIRQLKEKKAHVLHIDNPVYHLGLEKNKAFIAKTKNGLDTLVSLENQGKINSTERPIQLAYHKIIRLHLSAAFSRLIQLFQQPIERNLCSKKPSLVLFDLYKLGHYIKLKKKRK